MFDEPDLPERQTKKPIDLSSWSVEELEAYIERLQAEIERARTAMAARRAVLGAAEALFKKS